MGMLRSLTLKNIATISDTSVEFGKGLNVLTGETGSGKSVVIGGIMLVTGARADKTLVRPGTKTASVEAVFELHDSAEITIRREIGASGKSRVFLDDALCTLQELRTAVSDVVTLYSQRTTPLILKSSRQLFMLDGFAGSVSERESYRKAFHQWKTAVEREEELRVFVGESGLKRELLVHEMSIFDELKPSIDDYNELMQQRIRIRKALERSVQMQEMMAALGGEDGISARLSGIQRNLERNMPEKEDLNELVSQAAIAVSEAVNLIASDISDTEDASDRLSGIDARLDEYAQLISRCGGTIHSMTAYGEKLSQQLDEFDKVEKELAETRENILVLKKKLLKKAEKLSMKRRKAATKLAKQVVDEIRKMNMPEADFSIAFKPPALSVQIDGKMLDANGAESVVFMFSANAGMPMEPLESVASGGELSRLALALALVMADSATASTLVFDEIDAGTGGKTAHYLADSLSRAAASRQIIVISHLAQIASRADVHLAVSKTFQDGMPLTGVVPLLSRRQRLLELARLLGGGDGALEHAGRLLKGDS